MEVALKSKWNVFFSIVVLVYLFLATSAVAGTIQYTYDNLNRLILAEHEDGTTITYTYDVNGNRLTKTVILGDTTPPVTTANPPGNTYVGSFSVSLLGNETATIYYTIDGAVPDINSTEYTDPIQITNTTTLRFFAVDSSGNIEDVKTETYVINSAPIIIGGPPSGTCNFSDFTVNIGGTGVVAYKYRLDDGLWSDEIGVTSPIQLSDLSEGGYNLYVIGKDSIGNWQAEAEATTASWEIDIVAPGDINDDGHVDLADAVLAIQIVSGMIPTEIIHKQADINEDGKIGVQEVTYILQKVSGLR